MNAKLGKDLGLAREYAFQYLFHLQLEAFEILREQLVGSEDETELAQDIENFDQSCDLKMDQAGRISAFSLIKATIQNYDQLNKEIESSSKNWKLSRLNKVDHTVILLGLAEFKILQKNPLSIVINECVELSKRYGTQESPKFVNGVLDNLLKEAK